MAEEEEEQEGEEEEQEWEEEQEEQERQWGRWTPRTQGCPYRLFCRNTTSLIRCVCVGTRTMLTGRAWGVKWCMHFLTNAGCWLCWVRLRGGLLCPLVLARGVVQRSNSEKEKKKKKCVSLLRFSVSSRETSPTNASCVRAAECITAVSNAPRGTYRQPVAGAALAGGLLERVRGYFQGKHRLCRQLSLSAARCCFDKVQTHIVVGK